MLSGVLGFGASDASEKLEANLCRFGSQVVKFSMFHLLNILENDTLPQN